MNDIRQYRFDDPVRLIISIVLFSVVVFFNSLAWDYLMKSSGENVSRLKSIDVYTTSFVMRYVPGNVWAIMGRAVMNKKNGVKMIKTMWGWFIENISYLIVGMVFSLLVLLRIIQVRQELAIAIIVALPVCGILFLRYEWLAKIFEKFIKKRLPEAAQKETASIKITLKQKLSLIGIYMISWAVYSLQYLFVAEAVTDVAISDYLVLIGVNALSWSIGYLSLITPSGGGVREGVMFLALTNIAGVNNVDAAIIFVLARLTAIIGEILYFGFIKLISKVFEKNGK